MNNILQLSAEESFSGEVKRTALIASIANKLAHPPACLPISDLILLSSQAVQSLPSLHSRRVYAAHLTRAVPELLSNGFTREGVMEYLNRLSTHSPSSLNQCLQAIKLLVREADTRNLMDRVEAQAILGIKSRKAPTVRTGNWLTVQQARDLLAATGNARDAAVLSLLLGCGLRRSELSGLTWEHIQVRADRPVIANLLGKGQKLRSIGIPQFTYNRLLEYGKSGMQGKIFDLSPSGVWWVVKQTAQRIGMHLAPHDLRRTLAALAEENGTELRQIQADLGHSSIQTTERYLGQIKSLKRSSGDSLPL